jgi:hypothetical protein
MTTTTTTSALATRRNVALVVARVCAGLIGAMQLGGAFYFIFLAREDAVWLGPWIDVPVVAALVAGVLLKLTVAVGPGLAPQQRIGLGLVAVAIGIAVTLFKIPMYNEPESVTILVFDAVLLGLLLLARRGAKAT